MTPAQLVREVALPGAEAGRTEEEVEAEIGEIVGRLVELLGEDPGRAGLRDTPRRVARSLRWLTRGYRQEIGGTIGGAVFEEPHGSMVVVRGIEVYSLCEHHMLPFFGQAHIAYVPEGRIVGLSKLARVVDVFARRLQVQERLTEQIADALTRSLRPKGVAVTVEARHLCMMMRGVEKQGSQTVTSAVRGVFAECRAAREEFHRAIGGPARPAG